MLSEISSELITFVNNSKVYLYPWSLALAALWAVNLVNWLCGSKLSSLGIRPRRLLGLLGVFFCPILHQNFGHLFFNSIPLFVLGLAILGNSLATFSWVSAIVAILGGLLVWLFARRAVHIGASGLVSGYFGYILMNAYSSPGVTSILLAVLVLYYFGGILFGIFPQAAKVSWESHLFGFLSGLASSFLLPFVPLSLSFF